MELPWDCKIVVIVLVSLIIGVVAHVLLGPNPADEIYDESLE